MINVEEVRKDTPGCEHKIHFNNAGSSLPTQFVTNAMQEYLAYEAVTGGYEAADFRSEDIFGFYNSAAQLLNTTPKNIAFTSSATSAFDIALSSVPLQKGDVIIIANEDYISNQLALLSLQNRLGIRLVRANSLDSGGIDLDNLHSLIKEHQPKLVSITHVPTNTGLIQPVEEVGKLCRKYDVLYLLDACQSVGQISVDVKAIGCDFLSATMRKFLRGPRGAGFLYVSDNALQKKLTPLFVDMRGAEWNSPDSFEVRADAKRFEEWELPYALVVGSKAAIEYALKIGIKNISDRNNDLCRIIRQKLNSIELRTLDVGPHLSSIITVDMPGKQPGEVVDYLRALRINTSSSHRNYAQIDFVKKKVEWALRISPHYYNTEDEIDSLIQGLEDLSE